MQLSTLSIPIALLVSLYIIGRLISKMSTKIATHKDCMLLTMTVAGITYFIMLFYLPQDIEDASNIAYLAIIIVVILTIIRVHKRPNSDTSEPLTETEKPFLPQLIDLRIAKILMKTIGIVSLGIISFFLYYQTLENTSNETEIYNILYIIMALVIFRFIYYLITPILSVFITITRAVLTIGYLHIQRKKQKIEDQKHGKY